MSGKQVKRKRVRPGKYTMPRKRLRTSAKQPRRRYSSYKGVSSLTIKTPSGLPDILRVKLKFNFDATFSNTSGGYQELTIGINNIFDPSGSIGAVQPYLFDQWAALYENYQVHGFAYRLHPHIGPTGVSSVSARQMGIAFTESSTSLSTSSKAMQQPYQQNCQWSVNTKEPVIRGYIQCCKVVGLTPAQWAAQFDSYGAAITAAPTATPFAHIWTFDPYQSTTVDTMVTVQTTYYVTFFNRQSPALS